MSDIWAKVQVISPYLFQSNGMSSRRQFLLSVLAIWGVSVLVTYAVALTTGVTDDGIRGIEFLIMLWSLIPAIRRCHDLEWSGGELLWLLVPLVNLLYLRNLVFKKGPVLLNGWHHMRNPSATVEEELKVNVAPRKRRGPGSRPMR